MPLSLAEGHKKVAVLATAPVIMSAPTITELTAGIDASCRILENNFEMTSDGSDTVDEKTLCDIGTSEVPTNPKFKAAMTVFRYFDPITGKPDTSAAGSIGDALFQALKERGTEQWIVVRETSKLAKAAWVIGDECSVYHIITDAWQRGDGTGYIKRMIPMFAQGDSVSNALVGPVTP